MPSDARDEQEAQQSTLGYWVRYAAATPFGFVASVLAANAAFWWRVAEVIAPERWP